MAGTAAPVIAGLVAGAAFVMMFAMYANLIPAKAMSIVIIPEGSSIESSGKTFQPRIIVVMIGVNNTVVWVNQDILPSTVVADNDGDPDFFRVTSKPDLVLPSEEFRYTFTRPGEFGYHSEPHPWKRGTVVVLPGR